MDVNEVIRNTIIWDLEDSLKKKDAEIERLQYAVGIAVYELNFVAEEHECDQCREVATNIMKIAKGSVKNDENV